MPALALVGLYAAQSITGSMVQSALPVVLRDAGVGLDRIGLLSLLFIPWVLKVFWSPLVDRFATPRRWILTCQGLLCLCFLIGAAFAPEHHLGALLPVVFAMAVLAATQDIATDAAGVHATTRRTRSLASGASTVGGYAGFLIGGGLWLWIYARLGWEISMIFLAVAMLLLTLPVRALRIGRPEPAARPPSPLLSLKNPVLMRGAGLLLLWQGGVRLGLAMTGPMLVDAGFSMEFIGWLRGAGGMAVGLIAAAAGTVLCRRFGPRPVLLAAGGGIGTCCVGLAVWAVAPGALWQLAALQLGLSALTAVSFVALYAEMMNWCAPAQVATDFALLQSLDAALAVATGILAGQLAQHMGYAPVFGLAVVLLMSALPLVRHLAGTCPASEIPLKNMEIAE
ncbi:MFS transporter (putative signal transducer) [Rhodovulum sulfidophilum]|uniref:MFS transporter n=1 Tax=Rhodovulum sulfidophilum TaxID=35806 RepID=UPI0005A6191F|nr:MFS transporter [Rhodovulum sulfidophilum]ANB36348.1 hypothetical protein A6W98_19505 [Rhodovulum sulfidophilum DSM 1374]ANB40150.1 hypothetical protein A6024_19265 [Rhodovulum sulfidophilum]MCW2304743.1 MFS transporter (putative signal transducer) [Rhodovulum sulfidophilum]